MLSDKEYAILLAMEYGWTGGFDAEGDLTYDSEFVEAMLEAIQYEREACAKLCVKLTDDWLENHHPVNYAKAIRARGNKA